jgi:DNA-binding MarR family transcriptional regulator
MTKSGKEERRLCELMFDAVITHKRRMHGVAKQHGLTTPQAATLFIVGPGDGLAMSALAEHLMCDASNVTGIVDKLETRGLLKRVPGEDRRVKVLVLTDAGKQLREDVREQLLAPPTWVRKLKRDHLRMLCELLTCAKDDASSESADADEA